MNKIDEIVKKAHSAWKNGKEIEMAKHLEKAILLTRKSNNISKLIELLNDYGGSMRLTGNFDKAISILKEALILIKTNYSQNSLTYATTLMNLANTYREKKDYFEAENYFLKSKEIFQNLKDTSYSYVGLLNNLSLLYQDLGKYQDAKNFQNQAIDLLKDKQEYQVPLAISYNNLYDIEKNLKETENSLYYLEKAKNILLKEVSTNHPLYAAVLNNLADYNFQIKNYKKSLELYEEALSITKDAYGSNSLSYKSIKANCNYVQDFLNTLSPSNDSLKGLDKARILSKNVKQFIQKNYPQLYDKICIALVGTGSECLGYDDEFSRDHDYKTRCQLFLPKDIYEKYAQILEKDLSKNIKDTVIVKKITDFYKYFTLFEKGPLTNEEFRKVPPDLLATATNGQVFYDSYGEFSAIRKRLLEFYPTDIVYKKMAYNLNKMAQSGQYNYSRCLKRNDIVAANQALSSFIKHYIDFVHLINKKYTPFYKWSFKSCTNLNILGTYSKEKLQELIKADIDKKIDIISEICLKVVEILQEKKLSDSNIDFLTYQANQITKKIKDEKLKKEDSWIK